MTTRRSRPGKREGDIDATADDAYETIARIFPVCAASDEFYYYPQVLSREREWSTWDDFSEGTVGDFALRLAGWEEKLTGPADGAADLGVRVDARALQRALAALREQLTVIGPHRSQPSFHLSVVGIGLAEAAASDDPEAWPARAAGLPAFLDRAVRCLEHVPGLFLDLGLDMVRDLRTWVESLGGRGGDAGPAAGALGRFEASLADLERGATFLLSEEKVERIVKDHLGCGCGIEEARKVLDEEIREMEDTLEREAATLARGRTWREAAGMIPEEEAPPGGVLELYRREVDRLETHCLGLGIAPPGADGPPPLEVAAVPSYLAAVRASDSYSARPGFPPRGGSFFVFDHHPEGKDRAPRTLNYRMTTAHETWPGHHLLDAARWGLSRPLRRPLEGPLFYEGWACLAEEIMARTGYFSGPWDRFILSLRRLRRAVRGKVDLDLQGGRLTLSAAAAVLERAGFRRATTLSAARKYTLRPGYQVCYTLGLKKFLALLDARTEEDIGSFARAVLSQGEIGFDDLERVLRQGSGQ